jgi:hypothetical protein
MRRIQVLMALMASCTFLAGQQDVAPQADPPDQPGQAVARLGVISGDVSVRRGDSGDWVAAALNAPLMAGDSVAVPAGGSAELQLDYADFVRIGGDSEIRISDLESGRNQIQVAKGLITWRVLRDTTAQSEISTPSVAVHPLQNAAVRIEVTPDGASRIIVRRGDVEASTPRGTERIREGNMMLVRGPADDPEYQVVYASARDAFDNWNDQRDSYLERAQSNRYVSQDIYGAEDLDAYGRWGYDPAYGNVWTPTVAATWAPYRNGQWVWEDYYGWTWVDYDPWGWAPFHYGSWYFRTGYGWSWFPGQRYGHYWWRPAMVGFFGFGGGFGGGVGFGNVGWIPLAPYEVFHPWYGRGGWGAGRRFGVVNNVNIVNVYRNARFGNGVTAVSAQDFQRGVFRNQIPVNGSHLAQASLVRGGLPVGPTANNLRFSERGGAIAPPRGDIGNQRFFSRMPATGGGGQQRTPFAQQQAAVRSSFSGGGARGAAVAAQNGGGTGDAGWRRFGEPSGQPGFQRSFQSGSGGTRNEQGFRIEPPQQQRGRAGAGWDRFGSPQEGGRPALQPGAQSQSPRVQPEMQQGFAPRQAPQGRQEMPYTGRPSYNYNGGQSRALQVAPPIVRQREAPGGNFRGGGSAPSYRNAPAPSFRSAPAPSFRSAPAPSNRGGGGGGGGHAGGGAGHGGHR